MSPRLLSAALLNRLREGRIELVEGRKAARVRPARRTAGRLPSVAVIHRSVERVTDLRMLDLEDITEHYPETLRRWRENFVRSANRASELGYDLRFRRLWELYLAWCEGGFRERRIGDVQALLAKPSYRGYGSPLRRHRTRVLTQS